MFRAGHIDCGMVHREAPGTAILYERHLSSSSSAAGFLHQIYKNNISRPER
ncbi:hypothetical protein SBON0123_004030 [Salmonella bongori serovar 40:z35:- str. 95-0123]|uniref:Uncharacterized protein n=1 Tax=Salmonella bongori TaxID=54736 RepID=A0A698WAZ4_SALBN|nr:hypothetical protein [Salmonella bongori]EGE4656753.1 hypothetical protein [Salmonella bongori serovar 40:z35:- str. 95-0123]